jgi:hypothetical protein
MTDTQCQATFPGLFAEIERAGSHHKNGESSQITPEDLDLTWKDSGAIRAQIIDGGLYVLEHKFNGEGYDINRAMAILASIHRSVVTAPKPIQDIEFAFSVSDLADVAHQNHTIWSLARTAQDQTQWLMPDFGYWSWTIDLVGTYETVRQRMSSIEAGIAFEDKIPQAFWRGAVNNPVRSALMQKTRDQPWADVKAIKWSSQYTVTNKQDTIPIWDNCRWKYLIQTEGASYSGRGKYLHNCHSITLMPEPTWLEHYYSLLIRDGPDQNVVIVRDDFSDLGDQIQSLERDPERASRIAQNSVAAFRDRALTPAAQTCYWRRLFHVWREASFAPDPYEVVHTKVIGEERRVERRIRGVPYETFSITAFQESSCSKFRRLLWSC